MATELCPNEGKQWIGQNTISGATVYAGLIRGQTIGAATISATSVLSGLQEEANTGYARQSKTLGTMNSSGVLVVPSVTWQNGSNAWHSTVSVAFISSASSGGVALYYWDLSTTRDMSVLNATLTLAAVNLFFLNPGE